MFAISLKQDQYPTIILTDQQAHSRIEVVPERGGIISRWRVQGQDILYLDKDRFANPELSVRGGIPILFPICGNLPNNLYVHQSKSYTLKQHGFARDFPWEVVEQTTDDCASLTLRLQSNEKTRAVYPFDFELLFTYKLQGNRLIIEQRYTNQSDETMPFATGLHPYFWVTDKQQISLDIPASQGHDHLTKTSFPFTGKFDLQQEEIDVALKPVTRNHASLMNQRQRWRITLRYSDIYSTLVFWTVQGKDYCCLEPWSSPRNALNTKENLVYLQAGETCDASVEMEISYLNQ
ncbi:aldose epimerase [Spirulina sp. CS-785/01]|uniref:aldose epimerase family protein n=1 Tax=Spirulina sp. CS-785/01 TaxID=3021716 RepID=UPI00232D8A21|nr:aldose epimerase [Spirulina sp. CS-785/01]MDB9312654.1 aldose epimerase [Spirulina sp. CS-785/01]